MKKTNKVVENLGELAVKIAARAVIDMIGQGHREVRVVLEAEAEVRGGQDRLLKGKPNELIKNKLCCLFLLT
jgi:predicted ThiF/HesA family dinucleotide-utilizing enzyme